MTRAGVEHAQEAQNRLDVTFPAAASSLMNGSLGDHRRRLMRVAVVGGAALDRHIDLGSEGGLPDALSEVSVVVDVSTASWLCGRRQWRESNAVAAQ
jgi:hypothetical protein